MPSPRPCRHRVTVVLVTLLAVTMISTACSSSETGSKGRAGTSSATTGGVSTTTGQQAATPPEPFSGTDKEFYVPPDPLPEGKPGDLIRVKRLAETNGQVTVKVMYHSRDAQDRDRPVTGLVTYPTATPPKGGWPIVATAPGTTGVAARCAISHRSSQAPDWGVEGVRVMTDYLGLGPVGGPLHPYFSRPSEGHSVIDGVRAARRLRDTGAGDRWLSVGHSQGGHGALSASELASEYAPELDLVATLALAPAALFDRVYGGIDPIVTAILTSMSLYGGAAEHPEIRAADYVTPELAKASRVFETGCLAEITDALIPLAAGGKLFKADPRKTEPARSIVLANDVGNVVVDAPLLLVSGTADDRVVINRALDFYARLCRTGQVTELLIVNGATHDSIIGQTATRTAAWLNARLAGDKPTDSCADSPTAAPAP